MDGSQRSAGARRVIGGLDRGGYLQPVGAVTAIKHYGLGPANNTEVLLPAAFRARYLQQVAASACRRRCSPWRGHG